MASGQRSDLPQASAFIAIYRFTNAPGSVFTAPTSDPGIALILVGSGRVGRGDMAAGGAGDDP